MQSAGSKCPIDLYGFFHYVTVVYFVVNTYAGKIPVYSVLTVSLSDDNILGILGKIKGNLIHEKTNLNVKVFEKKSHLSDKITKICLVY